nr:Crp/Fnr family transcriptional regulator [uncultured Sphingomonas sp.]
MSSDFLAPLLRRWQKRSQLTPADVQALLGLPWRRHEFTREAYIAVEGAPVETCALIMEGWAYRQKILPNGARQIISIHIPGEFVDLQNSLLGVADHNVQSLGRSVVALTPASALAELARNNGAISKAMWLDTLVDGSIFREWVVNVGRRNAKERIAHLICEQALRMQAAGMGEPEKFHFPLTQEQLGDAVGLTPVHTNRSLQSLRRDRLIDYGVGWIKILDWPRLQLVGQFDELYLHHAV